MFVSLTTFFDYLLYMTQQRIHYLSQFHFQRITGFMSSFTVLEYYEGYKYLYKSILQSIIQLNTYFSFKKATN